MLLTNEKFATVRILNYSIVISAAHEYKKIVLPTSYFIIIKCCLCMTKMKLI